MHGPGEAKCLPENAGWPKEVDFVSVQTLVVRSIPVVVPWYVCFSSSFKRMGITKIGRGAKIEPSLQGPSFAEQGRWEVFSSGFQRGQSETG